jgi:16S rRNA (cytidine1402-2'-O)-methyltransferase
VTDAGTPAVSDPGAHLVAAVRAAGHPVSPVPGPNAAIAALSAAGLSEPHFLFYGFLPQRATDRRRALDALRTLPYAVVFYEAPHRVAESIADMRAAFGGARRIVVARELTKIHETMHECALADVSAWLEADANRRRGEFVLVVRGAEAPTTDAADEHRRVLEILLAALPLRQAVALAAEIAGGRRNELYALALELRDRRLEK